MTRKLENIPAVLPPALDREETELTARNEFVAELTVSAQDFEVIEPDVDDANAGLLFEGDEEHNEEAPAGRRARRYKRRKSLIFLSIFGAAFGIFVLFISWAFGFGFFSAPSRVTVDRNQKTTSADRTQNPSDEKLKTALAIVADNSGNNQNSPVISNSSANSRAVKEQDLSLSSVNPVKEKSKDDSAGNMIVLPNENTDLQKTPAQNQTRVSQTVAPVFTPQNSPQDNLLPVIQNFKRRTDNNNANRTDKADGGTAARSIFFGRVTNQADSVSVNSTRNLTNLSLSNPAISNENSNAAPFGTLLPVRFLGAVFTLQESGGLVRMELSRTVRTGGFAYRAGTVLVGRVRGSRTNRAFISVFGAIDQKTGKLVKFEGDVLGSDGASGVIGTRKSVKSWGTRFLKALREAGGQTVNILSSRERRGGGTVILSGTNGIGGEVSSVIRGNSDNDSFVEIRAGTEGYVLITDLPGEDPRKDSNGDFAETLDSGSDLNLSETEIAELLTTGDANKIRASLLKLSPGLRALAIKALEDAK